MPYAGQIIQVLVAMAIVVGLPALAGYFAGRWRHAAALAGILGGVALLLTASGYYLTELGRQLGTGDPDMAGLGDVIMGYFSAALGVFLGFFASATGLSRTARAGHWGRFALLLFGALLPLLATVGVFDFQILIYYRYNGGTAQSFDIERLVFAIAAVAPLGIVVYGLWAAVARWRDNNAGHGAA
jgi:hypothetical protein